MNTTELCNIMKECGSDKGLGWHNYTAVYHDLFCNKKEQIQNLFELGIGSNNLDVPSHMGIDGVPGASLRGWKKYFPKANIYGADIDKRILFEEDRIKTFYVDQTNMIDTSILWNNPVLRDIKFDIIIDDGLHEKLGTINFLINSFIMLKVGGYYIIEDIIVKEITAYENALKKLSLNLHFDFEIKNIPNGKNDVDNVLAILVKK